MQSSIGSTAAPLPLIPYPVTLEPRTGVFVIDTATVVTEEALPGEAAYLRAALAQVLGQPLVTQTPTTTTIQLRVDPSLSQPEGYCIEMTPTAVTLTGGTATGVFYAVQTLVQLAHAARIPAGRVAIPCVHIADQPRFGWRGLHLDVSRHFFTADEVCRLLDLMALHKFNRFHWHLTDDQGWRLPVAKYPRLTEIGGFRSGTLIGHENDRPRRYDDIRYGGYYTPAEIRRVVAHAAARHITVVPEIDLPGHMQAAISAYPELGCTQDRVAPRCHWGISQHILNSNAATIRFMQDVLAEVVDLFPGEFVHIGGDEALKYEWAESRAVQNRMAELGLKGEDKLQSWYIAQMGQFLHARGRRLIGWDEILEGGLPDGSAVMSWRGVQGGIAAAQAGHDVVMTPGSHTYFDHYQHGPEGEPLAIGGMLTVAKVHDFDPIPEALAPEFHRHILGAQGQLWSEYIGTMAQLEYMAFPRACALAEVVWSPRGQTRRPEFPARLRGHARVLAQHQVRHGPIAVAQ